MGLPEAILIAGPTASGKSAAALAVAAATGGAVVNADSMQVYRDLRILTARPTGADERAAPHVLYGHVDAADAYSAGRWLADAGRALDTLRRDGTVPIVVGGTGLYFRALTEGLSPIPAIPDTVRTRWRHRLETEGAPALHARLADRDPDSAARIEPADRQRIVRALEVWEATGLPLSDWQRQEGRPLLAADRIVRVFLDPDRDWLYRRIDDRFDAMMDEGALSEVAALKARGLSSDLPAMRAHGVPHFLSQLAGTLDPETALIRAKADVRHYAKRQKTWFRNQMKGWAAVPPESAADRVLERLRVGVPP